MRTRGLPSFLALLLAGALPPLPAAAPPQADGAAAEGELEPPDETAARRAVESAIEANAEEAAKLKAEFVDQLGVDESEYACCITDHVVLLARVEPEQAVQLTQIAEYVYRKLNWLTFGKVEANTFKPVGGRHHYYMVDRDSYEDLLVWLSEKYPHALPKKAVRYYLKIANKVGGASLVLGKPPMHFVQSRNYSSTAANGMGFAWLSWNTRAAAQEINIKTKKAMGGGRESRDLLNWFLEGVGIWSSFQAIGRNDFYRITQTRYANVGRAEKGGDSDYLAIAYEIADGQMAAKDGVKNFYQLTRAGLNQLSDVDLAMSWSIVDFMIKARRKQWRRLIENTRRKPSFRISMIDAFGTDQDRAALKKILTKTRSQDALDELYRKVCARFEKEWKAWVLQAYAERYEDPTKVGREPPFEPIEKAAHEGAGGDGKSGGEPPEKKKKKKKKKKKRRRRRRH